MRLPHSIDIDDDLTQAVWKFNFRPDLYTHSTWLQAMPEGKVVLGLVGMGRGQGRLAQHMLARLGIAESVYFDFRSPLSQIALWQGQDIEKLVEHIGAVLYRELARKVIARDDILRVRHALGEDLYAFMQQRAQTLTHKLKGLPTLPGDMVLRKRLILVGLLCLHAAFNRYPESFWMRVMFKLKRDWYVQWKRYAQLGKSLESQGGECAVLVQKVAIEIKMSVGHDGKILFN